MGPSSEFDDSPLGQVLKEFFWSEVHNSLVINNEKERQFFEVIKEKALKRSKDLKGNSILHWCAFLDAPILTRLIKDQLTVDVKTNNAGLYPHHIAAMLGNLKVLAQLETCYPKRERKITSFGFGLTSFHVAILFGQMPTVEYYMSPNRGHLLYQNLDFTVEKIGTVLHLAGVMKNEAMIDLLLTQKHINNTYFMSIPMGKGEIQGYNYLQYLRR